ncbi:MAG: PBP1A family penicillin-binding protein [Actinomycetes bacterium]
MRLAALLAVLGLLGLSAFLFGLLTSVAAQIPALDPARAESRQQANTYVYAADGHSILEILRGSQARVVVPANAISPWLKNAMVAAEDKRFYEHRGIDVHGIARALWTDITSSANVQGGSTITQQFVKNAINGNAPTLTRKLREAALAWQLEQRWSKDRILTAYLNTIYFGSGAYGVEQACRVYFGHSASTAAVTPAEAALLAGIPQNPSLYDPVAHPTIARQRRNFVLRQMLQQHYLDAKQYRRFAAAPMPKPGSVRLPATQSQAAPYFANYVTNQLLSRYPAGKVFGGGLKVTTTIDLGMQKIARDTVEKVLPASVGPTAALVVMNAHTGAVLAMVGGRNYHRSQFNLATQGERQPGSAFKPFVLAAALRAGISPATTLDSHKVTIDTGGRLWYVNNYEGEYLGPIDLSKAIAYSDNTVFAQLTSVVGPPKVAEVAAALGITTPLQPHFAIGLGAEPATPLEMARAYGSFADGGSRIDGSLFGNQALAIRSITDSGGRTLDNMPVQRRELSPELTAMENQMLQGVVSYGTGRAAQIAGQAVAGKTGTTENYGDAWFVGYTPDLVAAVWVGYPDGLKPMLTEFHGHAVTGGSYPALIWKTLMEKAIAYEKFLPDSFPPAAIPGSSPATVVNRTGNLLTRDNGNCKAALSVQFFAGAIPTAAADCKHNEVDVPDVRGETLAAATSRLALQPLQTQIVYRPAKSGQRVGVVLAQIPRNGTLSAYDKVTLVLPKATHGVTPKLVGLRVADARAKLAAIGVRVGVRIVGPRLGRVVAQTPRPGVAAGADLPFVLTTVRAGKAG